MPRVHSREAWTQRGYTSSPPNGIVSDRTEPAPLYVHNTRRITNVRAKNTSSRPSRGRASTDILSEGALERLNALNDRLGWSEYDRIGLQDAGSADPLHATFGGQIRNEKRHIRENEDNGNRGVRQHAASGQYAEKRGLGWSVPSVPSDDNDIRRRKRRHMICKKIRRLVLV